jgi:hypothetical protein
VTAIRWAKGGEARVVSIDDDAIVLRSTVPSPPGSRVDGALAAADGEPGAATSVRVKVHSSKKQEDGSFVIAGRVLDMTRALRERLVLAAGEGRGGAGPA